jgi:hypothetical protein
LGGERRKEEGKEGEGRREEGGMEGKIISSTEAAGRRLLNTVKEEEGSLEDVSPSLSNSLHLPPPLSLTYYSFPFTSRFPLLIS